MEDCAICGSSLYESYTHILSCGHTFHYECLLKSFKFKSSHYKNNNNCPYCRSPNNILPAVNGLKKLELGIHIKPSDYYKDRGLGVIYNKNLRNLQNVPCKAILKRGERVGKICGKNCKLGSYYCGSHKKFDNIINEEFKLNKLGDKQEAIEVEIAIDISKKILNNEKEKYSS